MYLTTGRVWQYLGLSKKSEGLSHVCFKDYRNWNLIVVTTAATRNVLSPGYTDRFRTLIHLHGVYPIDILVQVMVFSAKTHKSSFTLKLQLTITQYINRRYFIRKIKQDSSRICLRTWKSQQYGTVLLMHNNFGLEVTDWLSLVVSIPSGINMLPCSVWVLVNKLQHQYFKRANLSYLYYLEGINSAQNWKISIHYQYFKRANLSWNSWMNCFWQSLTNCSFGVLQLNYLIKMVDSIWCYNYSSSTTTDMIIMQLCECTTHSCVMKIGLSNSKIKFSSCITYLNIGRLRQCRSFSKWLQPLSSPQVYVTVCSNYNLSAITTTVTGKVLSSSSIKNAPGLYWFITDDCTQNHTNGSWKLNYIILKSINMTTKSYKNNCTTDPIYLGTTEPMYLVVWKILHGCVQSSYLSVVLTWYQAYSRGGLMKYNNDIPTRLNLQHYIVAELFLLTCLLIFAGGRYRFKLLLLRQNFLRNIKLESSRSCWSPQSTLHHIYQNTQEPGGRIFPTNLFATFCRLQIQVQFFNADAWYGSILHLTTIIEHLRIHLQRTFPQKNHVTLQQQVPEYIMVLPVPVSIGNIAIGIQQHIYISVHWCYSCNTSSSTTASTNHYFKEWSICSTNPPHIIVVAAFDAVPQCSLWELNNTLMQQHFSNTDVRYIPSSLAWTTIWCTYKDIYHMPWALLQCNVCVVLDYYSVVLACYHAHFGGGLTSYKTTESRRHLTRYIMTSKGSAVSILISSKIHVQCINNDAGIFSPKFTMSKILFFTTTGFKHTYSFRLQQMVTGENFVGATTNCWQLVCTFMVVGNNWMFQITSFLFSIFHYATDRKSVV